MKDMKSTQKITQQHAKYATRKLYMKHEFVINMED